MRIWLRIATVAGVALAWAGLWLAWERWAGLSDSDTTTGFKLPEADLFLYGLIAVTVIAAVYLYRLWKPVAIVLTLAALALAGLAARAALDLLRASSTFVDVRPGLGLWLGLAGAVLLVVASWPRPLVLAAGLVPLLALALYPASARPAGGEVADAVSKDIGTTMTLDGDTILTAVPTMGSRVHAWDPDGERYREAFDTSDVTSSFAEDIQALAVHGEDLYLSVTNHGVWKVPAGGRPTMLAIGPVENPDGTPERNPQKIPDFHPSRLVAAPDGSVYVLSGDDVNRYDGKQFAKLPSGLDDPQDLAVDRENRLYIADTGNGRVIRVGRDGKSETLIGASAPPGCAQQGLDEPESLDPARCHMIEALAVDSKGNLFVATGGVPRVLALTAEGRYGVVAGTGVAGASVGDGRAVSARIGGVNKLEVGPDDDLYVGEYERALRIADPLSGLGEKPGRAPAAPRDVCQAVANWGVATLRSHLVTSAEPPSLPDLRAAVNRLEGEEELKSELNKRYVDEESLDGASTASTLLREFGEEHCGLMDGLYPLDDGQAIRFCTTYLREWGKVQALKPGDDRQKVPAQKAAALLGPDIFPPRAPRTPNWDGQILQFAQGACAIPYRWSTRYAD